MVKLIPNKTFSKQFGFTLHRNLVKSPKEGEDDLYD